MDIQELAQEYESKSDEELLRLALQREELTPEALAAPDVELAKRRISDAQTLNTFRQNEEEQKTEADKNPGRLFLLHPYGIGRKRFGKADYRYDSETRLERFKTTVFIVLLWIPLIPTGTYLIERKRQFLSGEFTVREKVALDWEQILKVWIATAGMLLAVIWTFKFVIPRLLFLAYSSGRH